MFSIMEPKAATVVGMNRERHSLARSCFVCNLADVNPRILPSIPSLLFCLDVRILSVRGLILFFCCSRERAGSAEIRELHCQVRMIYSTNISIHQQHRIEFKKKSVKHEVCRRNETCVIYVRELTHRLPENMPSIYLKPFSVLSNYPISHIS